MRIGIDGIILRGRDAGSLRYFEQLLAGLSESEQSNEYVVFANQRILESSTLPRKGNFHAKKVDSSKFLPTAVQQQTCSVWRSLGELDLLHSPVFVPPLRYPGKTVMTIFDLTFLLYPKTQKWTGRLWWKLLGPPGIKKASQIITISESTKKDVCQSLNIPIDRVHVAYPYAQSKFRPVLKPQEITAKYGLPKEYVLFVGTLERRKNIVTLLRAFAIAKQDRSLRHCLVLVGQLGWLYEDIFKTIEDLDLKELVIFLKYVPDEDLPGLYSGADLFVYLSFYEGFGLPVLEAMACGVPVLTSNTSALPEVVGDAGLLVSPTDVNLAAHDMGSILSDPGRREELAASSLKQATKFSMERFIHDTLAVYNKAVSQS